ncbi:hypothetical protein IJJ97_04875 [bacterium]|nr:hypothetical protein [bacterium]
MKKIKTIFTFLLIFFVSYLQVMASEDIKKGEPLIISDQNVNTIDNALKNLEDYPFAVLQVTKKENIPASVVKSLKEYINKGGTLWFYDSRFADFFGMKNSPMEITNVEIKTIEAEYGSGKMTGVGIGATALKGSQVTKGIRRLAVFIIVTGKNKYSAVKDEGVIPLLRVPTQKSLVGAIKEIGKGKVIFKPLLWEKEYDGASFQRKLIRYSRNPKFKADI